MVESYGSTIAAKSPADDGAELPLERLEAQLCELAGHLAAATCRFLILVGEFDARRGWASWDLPSCAAWLSWKCQIAPGTAREHVRVARALRELPAITAEFAAGRMSYAKARALTRIATPQNNAGLVELAGPMTAGQLDRFVAAHRRVTNIDDQDAQRMRRLSFRVDDDGSLSMTVRLPAADGAVVLKALRAAAGDLEHPHHQHDQDGQPPLREDSAIGDAPDDSERPDGGDARTPASLADALVDVAGAFLSGKIAAVSDPDLYQVIVHVSADALADESDTGPESGTGVPAGTPVPNGSTICHLADGPAISPATAQRLACAATVSWMLHDHTGNLLDVGRRHRRPPPALRRAVRARDRYRCQYPACESRRTDIHHIVHWANGGKTRLSDLISLCEAHHIIVHARGYLIAGLPGGGFCFTRPDGTMMPASPQLPGANGAITSYYDADITDRTIVPAGLGDKLNLDMAIWACFANARLAGQTPAPAAA